MTSRTVLLKEIDSLPSKYFSEVIDFVGYLRKKTQESYENDVAEYKAMATDNEREQEAQEWCNSYFGPAK